MGFVSNSSSSSFCIYGTTVDPTGDEEEYETMESKAYDVGLEMYYPEGYDTYYIGKSTSSCPDDKTMGQFKKEVAELIKKHFGKTDCSILSESYYS